LVPQHWFVFFGMKCCLIGKDHCTTYPSQEFCDPQNIPKPTRRCDRRLKEHCLASIENRLNSRSGTGWHRRVGAHFGVARSAFFGVQKTVKSDKTAFFPGRREPNAAWRLLYKHRYVINDIPKSAQRMNPFVLPTIIFML